MIDGKTIQRIKKEISIKEVVEEYTTLYKKKDNKGNVKLCTKIMKPKRERPLR